MVRVRKQHGERSWCSTDYSFQKRLQHFHAETGRHHFRHLWQACDACDLRCGSLGNGDLLVSKTLAWQNLSSNTGSAGVMSLWCPTHSTYSRTQFSRLQIELRGFWWMMVDFFHFFSDPKSGAYFVHQKSRPWVAEFWRFMRHVFHWDNRKHKVIGRIFGDLQSFKLHSNSLVFCVTSFTCFFSVIVVSLIREIITNDEQKQQIS